MNLLKIIPLAAALGFVAALADPGVADAAKRKPVAKSFAGQGGQSRAKPGDTCLGVSACNTLIVECVMSGLDFNPIQTRGPNGEPSYGQCVKRTD